MPYSDPKKQVRWNRLRRDKLREWFWELKKTLSCEKCGFSHPAAMQFHHLEKKIGPVGRLVCQGNTKEKILSEMKKCQVLCANCHAILHDEEEYSHLREIGNGRIKPQYSAKDAERSVKPQPMAGEDRYLDGAPLHTGQ